ncbi:MAG: L,D-transpeptidase family protein [Candidatus Omnitrophota bacterium]
MKKNLILVIVVVLVIGALGFFLASGKGGSSSDRPTPANQLYQKACELESQNEILEAIDICKNIIADFPNFSDINTVQKKLEDLNLRLILSATETPKTASYEVKPGDSLAKISKEFNVTVDLIKKSNNLTSDTIRIGQKLRIWKGVFSVFVDKSQNILMLKSDDDVVKVYTVSTGKNNNTPVGTFTIVSKLVNPVWYKSGAVIPPQSPENALGSRWMGFDIAGYGIHGTIEPQTLGQITAGCVRMLNAEVEELYSLLPNGTKVTVVD